ncbi:branched-chain amino acid ABC transporter permease [Saccharospirillum sp. MSK14-1]|uniref:branched-chain amino acid ABC transporter permease n=1 Tax=Saccharospirillum sp. MSK14-1 TaxID=1897632 RepID=UPI000D349DE3|nr:branched-chain amino acid ABC transporter permease [Saccharospirillum sp. MSK14-1]PTY38485.1 branched-chain amino acid ABC transporter permease [Saccharospirillum sp. MSK14-1]
MQILITGILLGGVYAIIAVGLSLQYGVARIMNLALGEMLVAGAFAAFWFATAQALNPYWALLVVVPGGFIANWLIYQFLLRPLVRRAKNRGQLEVDSILATFGLSFTLVGIFLWIFGGQFFNYSFLSVPVELFDSRYGQNRVLAFAMAVLICGALWIWLNHTRSGLALRAISVDPKAASLVAIDVEKTSAFAFALGGAVAATGGLVLSTFLTFDASIGIVFTLKALIIVIMGGVGDIRGAVVAALVLGITETLVARLIDPGLTLAAAYVLFLLILLFRPQGLFGRSQS